MGVAKHGVDRERLLADFVVADDVDQQLEQRRDVVAELVAAGPGSSAGRARTIRLSCGSARTAPRTSSNCRTSAEADRDDRRRAPAELERGADRERPRRDREDHPQLVEERAARWRPGSRGKRTLSSTRVRRPDCSWLVEMPCWRPMMPPTPLSVKPKPSWTARELAVDEEQQRPAVPPPGSFVVRMPIALIDTGPIDSSRTPAYSPFVGRCRGSRRP